MLSLFILVPLLGLILLNLPVKDLARKAGAWLALFLAVAQVAVVVFCPVEELTRPTSLSSFMGFTLHLDSLSRVMLLAIGLVLACTVVVGQYTISDDRRRGLFADLLLVAMIGMNGTVLLQDVFTLYVFVEITSIASFIMIALERGQRALEGAFKYLVLSAVATIMMLTAVGLLMLTAGETSFAGVARAVQGGETAVLVKVALGAFACGLLIKGGVVPFHGWLPAAYSTAPAAVSVFLAGIATKVSGVYALIRLGTVVFIGEPALGPAIMAVGALSIVVGALAALRQADFKQMLAYSSISQVGYIILALGCAMCPGLPEAARQLALAGAVFHLFNHAVFKGCLFVNSAALERQLGTTDMNLMRGLGAKMPWTSLSSVIAALSTAGVPPLSGFWSKLVIVMALWQAKFYGYAFVAVLASVLTLAYFLGLQRRVFFGNAEGQVKEAPFGLVLPAIVLAALTVALGLLLPYVLNTWILPVKL